MIETHPMSRRLAYHRFHQDWDLVATDPDEIVRHVVRYDGVDAAQLLIAELRAVLNQNRSEADLEAWWLDDLGSGFEPASVTMTYRQWLEHVVDVLRTAS